MFKQSLQRLRVLVFVFGLGSVFCSVSSFAEDIYIDVRSAQEFDQGHLSQAINIPHDLMKSEITQHDIKHDSQIYLYCRSGRRAELAKADLQALGFKRVINLKTLEAAKAHALAQE